MGGPRPGRICREAPPSHVLLFEPKMSDIAGGQHMVGGRGRCQRCMCACMQAYHKNKALGSLAFLPVQSAGACVCPEKPEPFGQASGSLVYHKVDNQTVDVGAGATGFRSVKIIMEFCSIFSPFLLLGNSAGSRHRSL